MLIEAEHLQLYFRFLS